MGWKAERVRKANKLLFQHQSKNKIRMRCRESDKQYNNGKGKRDGVEQCRNLNGKMNDSAR